MLVLERLLFGRTHPKSTLIQHQEALQLDMKERLLKGLKNKSLSGSLTPDGSVDLAGIMNDSLLSGDELQCSCLCMKATTSKRKKEKRCTLESNPPYAELRDHSLHTNGETGRK